MTRIEGSPPRGFAARLIFFFTRRKLGKIATPLRVTAHHKGVLVGMAMMEQQQAKAKRVPVTLKGLAQIRTSTLVGCPF
jgi:hypothetical protein